MSTIEDFIKQMPPVTKYFAAAIVCSTIAYTIGIVSPMSLAYFYDMVIKKFQIWRLLTTFTFVGGLGINLTSSIRYSSTLETNFYGTDPTGTANYVFTLLFGMLCFWIVGIFFTLPFLSTAFIFYIIYIWSRKDPHNLVSFWGFNFKSWHFPFVLAFFTLLIGGSPVLDILGILVGHLFIYLNDIIPAVYGVTILKTPDFISKLGRRTRSTYGSSSGYRLN